MLQVSLKNIGDLTYDVGFKFFFKDPRLKFYVASIISDMLNIDYLHVYDNMRYLDVELVNNLSTLIRSDVIIEIDDIILIFEMNRLYYDYLNELKIRYANHIYGKMFYINEDKEYEYNGKKIILVMINAFKRKNNTEAISKYNVVNKKGKKFTKYLEALEINLERVKENWYNKVTISKHERRLLYLLMTRKSKEEIQKFVEGDEVLMEAEKNRIDLENGKIYLDYDVELENGIMIDGIRKEGRAEGMAAGLAKGQAEGRAETNLENAKKMKENGIALELISKITGLSKNKIMSL